MTNSDTPLFMTIMDFVGLHCTLIIALGATYTMFTADELKRMKPQRLVLANMAIIGVNIICAVIVYAFCKYQKWDYVLYFDMVAIWTTYWLFESESRNLRWLNKTELKPIYHIDPGQRTDRLATFKRLGYIEPHKLKAIRQIFDSQSRVSDKYLKDLEAAGFYAFIISDNRLAENVTRIFNDFQENQTTPLAQWTCGIYSASVRPENSTPIGFTGTQSMYSVIADYIFVFRDRNEATAFRLRYC